MLTQVLAQLQASNDRLDTHSERLDALSARLAMLEGEQTRRSPSPTPPPSTPDPLASRNISPAPPVDIPPPAIVPTDAIPTSMAPRVEAPAEFSGKPSEYRNFMVKCNLVFTLCPALYVKDFQRTTFVLSRLTGNAATYTRHISEDDQHPLRHNFTKFKAYLDNVYVDRDYCRCCAHRLAQLRQTRSVTSYAVDFKTLVEPLEYGNNAKCDRFYEGLHYKVKEAIQIQGQAKLFDDLVEQAIRIDEAQYRAIRERDNRPSSSRRAQDSGTYDKRESSGKTYANAARPQNPRSSFESSNSRGRSRSRSRSRSPPRKRHNPGQRSWENHPVISEEERNRRLERNLCLKCGRFGHWKDDCHSRRTFEGRSKHFERQPRQLPEGNSGKPVVHAIIAPSSSENNSPRVSARSEA